MVYFWRFVKKDAGFKILRGESEKRQQLLSNQDINKLNTLLCHWLWTESYESFWEEQGREGKYLSGYRSTNNLKTQKRSETKGDRSSSGGEEETVERMSRSERRELS